MNLDHAFSHIAVIGAAGKMGSGISLLLLQEMAKKEMAEHGKAESTVHRLTLIDSNMTAISGLHTYLRSQMLKYAEKNINILRKGYTNDPHLVSNEEMIQAYVDGAMKLVNSGTELEEARGAHLLFEAIVENVEAKCAVYQNFASIAAQPFYVFTNTSSIPISVLNTKAHLQNRIIGFHFYNPPAIQKLVELIPLATGEPAFTEWAEGFAKCLNKIVVKSKDVAGFIGNGYFLREVVFACAKVRELSVVYSLSEAIYIINSVTQDFLLRPMGIFQLLDYVGLDVAQKIGNIMNTYLPDGVYDSDLVDVLLKEGIAGGQHADGSQKNGFFHYTNGKPDGVYLVAEKRYLLFDEGEW
jgi:3-hydroxyacyl-CoA dehydrogenase